MAKKKTLADIKKCPIDFLYLWAGEDFISQLGNKASIIAEKKYNQSQALWRIVVDVADQGSESANLNEYKRWVSEIGNAIYDIYNRTPAEILIDLANGKTVAGKNFNNGVFGVGESASTSFVQNSNYQVNPETGQIMAGSGNNLKTELHQTPIYGESGDVTGYSYTVGNTQYQSHYQNGQYVALSYSDVNGVQKANGGSYDATEASFWQNAENYVPMINSIVEWVLSLISQLLPGNRTVLTTENTVPKQSEWVYEEKSNAGGALLALAATGALIFGTNGKKNKNK